MRVAHAIQPPELLPPCAPGTRVRNDLEFIFLVGIPKFYRWLSERYPLLNQHVSINGAPEIDNLYLDMNGIIHNCTHGNDDDVGFMDEENMMVKILAYIDSLMRIIKPKQLLYMAIDGVAPRAKMNQQRSRRFRSAKEASEALEAARRRGEPVPEEGQRFDSNCITPGTEFMANLSEHLIFMIRKKQSEDPLWRKPTIVLSGHEVPGEGEHKIMEYLRLERLKSSYKPNQRHCLYGLDADLIMLSLVTHEPHFCLLREVVQFGSGRGRPTRDVLTNPSEDNFMLFQIGMLRDYLDLEFKSAYGKEWPFPYCLERLIDDFVLLCMLVGNDFLPPLPTLDIAEGALNTLWETYKRMLPTLGGFMTDEGRLDARRLELMLEQIGLKEAEVLSERAKAAEDFAEKNRKGSSFDVDVDEEDEVDAAMTALAAEGDDDDDDADTSDPTFAVVTKKVVKKEPEMMNSARRRMMLQGEGGLQAWRASYYADKMGVTTLDTPTVTQLAHNYLEGIMWVLEYYYRGVVSWTWFYPYHYAPMASDMKRLESFRQRFQYGKPFLPFHQLMAVLPPASMRLIPPALRPLMLDSSSPILDFYPLDFDQDHEGKRNDWEAVVLVPFIDEKRLLTHVDSVDAAKFTAAERRRNKLGVVLTFTFDMDGKGIAQSTLPGKLSSVNPCLSKVVSAPPPEPLQKAQPGFQPKLLEGTVTGAAGPPGFASLRTLKVSPRLYMAGVNVFGTASKKDSLVLQLRDPGDDNERLTAARVAAAALGKRCHVQWPFLVEALVVAVSDAKERVEGGSAMSAALLGRRSSGGGGQVRTQPFNEMERREWQQSAARCANEMLTKRGIDVGRTDVLLHVRVCEGLQLQADGALVKRWADELTLHPLHATLQSNPNPDTRTPERDAQAAEQLFPVGSVALCLSANYYGQLAEVLDHQDDAMVVAVAPPNPTLQQTARRILTGLTLRWQSSGQAARALKVGAHVLGMLTGSVSVDAGESFMEVGLNLKSGGKNLCIPDYTRPSKNPTTERIGWEYSDKAIVLAKEYTAAFPWLVAGLSTPRPEGAYQYPWAHFFPGADVQEAQAELYKAKVWLKKHPISKRPLVDGHAQVTSEDAIRALQAAMPPPTRVRPVVLEKVSKELLLKPMDAQSAVTSALASDSFALGDRVASMMEGKGRPPVGQQGSVVGVHPGAVEVLFDEPFVGGSDLQGRCVGLCGAFLKNGDVLSVTAGRPGTQKQLPKPRLAPQASAWLKKSKMVMQPPSQPVKPSVAAAVAMPVAAASSAAAAAAAALKPRRGESATAAPAAATTAAATPASSVPQTAGMQLLSMLQGGAAAPPRAPPDATAAANPGQQILSMLQASRQPQPAAATEAAAPMSAGGGDDDVASFWMQLSHAHATEAASVGGWDHPAAFAPAAPLLNCQGVVSGGEGNGGKKKKSRSKKGGVANQLTDAPNNSAALAAAAALANLNVGNGQNETQGKSKPKKGQVVAVPITAAKAMPSPVQAAVPVMAPPKAGMSDSEQAFWALLTKGKQ